MEKSHLANDSSVEVSKSVDQRDASPSDGPKPKPNGGIQAWLQVAGSFILYLNTWGELGCPVLETS